MGGSVLVVFRAFQHLTGKRKQADTLFLSWALGGVLFALGIALKSPHYLILWLVPLYIVISGELVRGYKSLPALRQKRVLPAFIILLLVVNIGAFKRAFCICQAIPCTRQIHISMPLCHPPRLLPRRITLAWTLRDPM